MKWQEVVDMHQDIVNEVGGITTDLEQEIGFTTVTGKRLGEKPYRFEVGASKGLALVTVKYRDRSQKVVARYIYQAIAEILWPKIPYWKHRWFGIVMAQPEDFPKGVKVPEGAQSRTRLLALTKAQVKRVCGNGKS